jgi:poly-gamma-glutamate synthesis protein (capsule biosynthesis protein)
MLLLLVLTVGLGGSASVWVLEADAPVEAAHDGGAAPATTRPSTTTRPPTTTTTLPPPRSATIVFGGDVLIHQGVWSAAATAGGGFDFSPLLAPIAPALTAADLALCHLEVTLSPVGGTLSGYPRFRAPAALATDLAEAGFDGCSVASNHALDAGAAGITATLDLLDAAGLGHAGTARTPEEDRRPATYAAGGIAVAHLSYAYGFNGLPPPAEEPWRVDPIDPARILADAHAARAAGAEVVIVSLHWGNEYDHDVTAYQQGVADALAAEPGAVDLIVGHHAHVVQSISQVGDLWVVWGMGNLLSNNSPRCCLHDVTDGVLVTVTLGERPDRSGVDVTGMQFTPTWNERRTFRVLPAAETLAAGVADPALAADLRASYDRTTQHVLALSGGTLPVTPTAALPPG